MEDNFDDVLRPNRSPPALRPVSVPNTLKLFFHNFFSFKVENLEKCSSTSHNCFYCFYNLLFCLQFHQSPKSSPLRRPQIASKLFQASTPATPSASPVISKRKGPKAKRLLPQPSPKVFTTTSRPRR